MTTIRMSLDAATITADTEARSVAGVLVPYGIPGRTSLGMITVRAGAIEVPDHIGRVKLLNGHDRDQPIGQAIDLDDGNDALFGTFAVARTDAGTNYLAELDPIAPVRDGLSVELDDVTLDGSEVTYGRLVAVAAVPLPAYSTARATLAAEETTTPQEETPPMSDTQPIAPVEAAPVAVLAAETPARPLTEPAPARTSPVSAPRMLAERVAAAKMDGSAPTLLAALADITPTGNGAGNEDAALARQALGELWNNDDTAQHYTPHVNGAELTGITVDGWRWNPSPEVADYTGNKAEVPSNAAKLEAVSADAARLAGAHDLDRIYQDLGSPAMLESYWRAMVGDLAVKIDARARGAIITAGGTADATFTDPIAAIVNGTMVLRGADYALVAPNLVEWISQQKASDALVGFESMPPMFPGYGLADGVVLVGKRKAVRQHTFRPPVRVQAVNIPNGGVDAGLFSYTAELIEDANAVKAYAVTPVAAMAATTTRKS